MFISSLFLLSKDSEVQEEVCVCIAELVKKSTGILSADEMSPSL